MKNSYILHLKFTTNVSKLVNFDSISLNRISIKRKKKKNINIKIQRGGNH